MGIACIITPSQQGAEIPKGVYDELGLRNMAKAKDSDWTDLCWGVLVAAATAYVTKALFCLRDIPLDASWREVKVGGIWLGMAISAIVCLGGLWNSLTTFSRIQNTDGYIHDLKNRGNYYQVQSQEQQ